MPVKQISASVEKISGKLSELDDYLDESGINILALSVANSKDIPTIRLVASDPEKAANVLKTHDYSVKMTDVLAVEVPDHPGGLNAVLRPLKEASIQVHCLYACLGRGEKTILILEVDRIPETIEALKKNWIHVYDEMLYTL